jgi:hypothetical protein
MTPEMYTVSRLAVEFGLDRRSVAKRIGPVKPARTEGRSKLYLLKTVAPFLVDFPDDDGLDYHGQRTRLTKLQADRIQFELEVEQGKYCSLEEIFESVGDEYTRVRARLLALPSTIAPLLVNHTNPAIPFEIVQDGVYQALDELSQPAEVCKKKEN